MMENKRVKTSFFFLDPTINIKNSNVNKIEITELCRGGAGVQYDLKKISTFWVLDIRWLKHLH